MQLTLLASVYISKSYTMLFSSWKLSFTCSAHSHLKLHLFEETSWGLIFFFKKKKKSQDVSNLWNTPDFFSEKLSFYWCLASGIVLSDVTQLLSSPAFGFKENISIHLKYKVLYKNEVLVTGNEISSSFFSIVKCSNFVHFEV